MTAVLRLVEPYNTTYHPETKQESGGTAQTTDRYNANIQANCKTMIYKPIHRRESPSDAIRPGTQC